jgi:DNA uptake protein ComE-like DNA-binding protein
MAFEISNHAKYEMPFKAVEELKELNTINDSVYQKIYHYFVVY